jgi:hypothetical protein
MLLTAEVFNCSRFRTVLIKIVLNIRPVLSPLQRNRNGKSSPSATVGAPRFNDRRLASLLNSTLVSNILLDTTQAATDTIDCVATDNNGLTATSTRTVIINAETSSSTIATLPCSVIPLLDSPAAAG